MTSLFMYSLNIGSAFVFDYLYRKNLWYLACFDCFWDKFFLFDSFSWFLFFSFYSEFTSFIFTESS